MALSEIYNEITMYEQAHSKQELHSMLDDLWAVFLRACNAALHQGLSLCSDAEPLPQRRCDTQWNVVRCYHADQNVPPCWGYCLCAISQSMQ